MGLALEVSAYDFPQDIMSTDFMNEGACTWLADTKSAPLAGLVLGLHADDGGGETAHAGGGHAQHLGCTAALRMSTPENLDSCWSDARLASTLRRHPAGHALASCPVEELWAHFPTSSWMTSDKNIEHKKKSLEHIMLLPRGGGGGSLRFGMLARPYMAGLTEGKVRSA